jgi:hypothetical protein
MSRRKSRGKRSVRLEVLLNALIKRINDR